MTRTREEKEQIVRQELYGDDKGNITVPDAPKTMQEKIQQHSKAKLLRAGQIAALAASITAHQIREKKTVPLKKLERWPDREPHSTEAPLAGRRGKKSRRQRKSGR
jgi:primosomal protein N''